MQWTYAQPELRDSVFTHTVPTRARTARIPQILPQPAVRDSQPAPEPTPVDEAARELKLKLQRCIQIVGPYRPRRLH